jgi:hypothetical protein
MEHQQTLFRLKQDRFGARSDNRSQQAAGRIELRMARKNGYAGHRNHA